MTEFKAGDRVTHFGQLEVVKDTQPFESTVTVKHPHGRGQFVVFRSEVTKIAPELPKKIGTVIDSHGYRFILTNHGWHATTDKTPFSVRDFGESMYAQDFTVVLEGK